MFVIKIAKFLGFKNKFQVGHNVFSFHPVFRSTLSKIKDITTNNLMKPQRHHLLINYVFIAGLLLLALNDHLWKDLYGNWITGKLSDFAGVLILPIFLAYIFNTRGRGVIVATVLFFAYWKSPLSQGLIDGINAAGLVHYARVVDYTDLIAFAVLPLSWRVIRAPESYLLPVRSAPALSHYLLLPLSLFFLIATSDDEDFMLPGPGINECCINGFTLDSLGGGRIYIPSAFTPDADGLNDLFRVIVDTGIQRIDTLRIKSLASGDTIFTAVNIANAEAATTGWDGSERGLTEPQQFAYDVWLTANDGSRIGRTGFACSIPCRTPTGLPRPVNLDDCRFGDQVDAAGFFDDAVATGELLDCFE